MAVEPRIPATSQPADAADAATAGPRSRRSLLAAGLGGLLGVAAGALGRPGPADAAPGDALRLGQSNSAGGSQTVLTSSAGGAAFTLKDTAVGGTGQFGWSSAVTGSGRGLYGRADSPDGYGIHAVNAADGPGVGAALRATGTATSAIYATSAASDEYAVQIAHGYPSGEALRADGGGAGIIGVGGDYGVVGASNLGGVGVDGLSTTGTGVRGVATTTGGYGVYGSSPTEAVRGISGNGVGVVGGSTTGTGVYGESGSGYAGAFIGDVFVSGTIDGAALSTTIDHPLDPAAQLLELGAIGSPERLVLTSGRVDLDADGTATVRLPAWFAAMHDDARHQLTAIGSAMPDLHLAAVEADRFEVAGGAPGGRVGWQVAGVRRDAWAAANPLRLERAKRGEQRGRYVHPVAHGQPADRSLAALHGPKRSVHEPAPDVAMPTLERPRD